MNSKPKRGILFPSRREDYLMVGAVALGTGALFLTLYFLMRHEELVVLRVDERRVVTIYAEGEFFYEPPGYISCEITSDGRVVVPERHFWAIGDERIPNGPFSAISGENGKLLAITLSGDVRFIYDFGNRLARPLHEHRREKLRVRKGCACGSGRRRNRAAVLGPSRVRAEKVAATRGVPSLKLVSPIP